MAVGTQSMGLGPLGPLGPNAAPPVVTVSLCGLDNVTLLRHNLAVTIVSETRKG